MPKPPPPKPPTLFPDASQSADRRTPQTVSVEQVVEAAKTGTSIAPPDPPPPESPAPTDQVTTEEHPNAPPPSETLPTPAPDAVPAQSRATVSNPLPELSLEKRGPLPFYPTNTDEMYRYAANLSRSDLLPRGLRNKDAQGKLLPGGKVADIFMVLMKGHDFGWHPMVSLATINIIEGKAEIGALAMVALIRKSGLCQVWRLVKSDTRSAIFETQRRGDLEITPFEYTIEEAEQMGLLDKGKTDWAKANNQWKLQPRTMLRRRCQSALAREVFPDICLGLYDHEELSEMAEVAARLGMSERQVSEAIEVPIGAGQPALVEAGALGPIERLQQAARSAADPLKARLQARAATIGGTVRRCSACDTVLDPRDSDPCIACRPEPAA